MASAAASPMNISWMPHWPMPKALVHVATCILPATGLGTLLGTVEISVCLAVETHCSYGFGWRGSVCGKVKMPVFKVSPASAYPSQLVLHPWKRKKIKGKDTYHTVVTLLTQLQIAGAR